MGYLDTVRGKLPIQNVVVVHDDGSEDGQRHELEALIKADQGIFAIDAPIYDGDLVETIDPRDGGTRTLYVSKVDINDGHPKVSNITAHWGVAPEKPRARRRLMSLMFTDIVGSTEELARRGDKAWSEALAGHRTLIRTSIETHYGVEVDNAGDGFFATFESLGDAVDCALDVVEVASEVGIEVRVGVHVGEVEVRDKPEGLNVHLASRVMSASAPASVTVTKVTQDLLASDSRFAFEDLGEQALKGIGSKIPLARVKRTGARP